MPWGPGDAEKKDSKANTPKLQREWADIADSMLKRTGDEAEAICTANGVIKHHEGQVKHHG